MFAATEYSSLGWVLSPVWGMAGDYCLCGGGCASPGKHPKFSQWQRGGPIETGDNVALVTGERSGVVVVDIDVKRGIDGHEELARIGLELPETLSSETPSGGRHYFYRYWGAHVPNSASDIAPGVDVRGDNGYVLIPPSRGADEREYEWVNWGDAQIAEAPGWLREWAERKQASAEFGEAPADWPELKEVEGRDLERAIEYAQRFKAAVAGTGGVALSGVVRALVRGFKMPLRQVEHILLEHYNPRCSPPWDLDNPAERRNWNHTLENAPRMGEAWGKRLAPAVKGDAPPLTSKNEITIARHFVESLGVVVSAMGDLHLYDEKTGVWSPLAKEAARSRVQDYHGALYLNEDPKTGEVTTRTLSMSVKLRDNVVNAALHDRSILDDSFFDDPTPGVAVANGFLTQSLELVPHAPNHRATGALAYEHTAGAPRKKWLKFLDSLFEGDEDADDKKAVLQEFAGACVMGVATQYQKYLILKGEGSNGKSTLTDILGQALFVPETRSCVSPHKWSSDYFLSSLRGVRANFVGELPANEIVNTDTFKQVITGEKVQARTPYHSPFQFRPTAGHLFACNELPPTVDVSNGFWRRAIIISFNRTFEEKDPGLIDRVLKESAGIMGWAVEGAHRLKLQQGYTKVGSHDAEMRDWRIASDPVAAFLASCCEEGEGWTESSLLYQKFRVWAAGNGRHALSNRKFFLRLSSLGVGRVKTTNGRRGWRVDLKPEGLWEPDVAH